MKRRSFLRSFVLGIGTALAAAYAPGVLAVIEPVAGEWQRLRQKVGDYDCYAEYRYDDESTATVNYFEVYARPGTTQPRPELRMEHQKGLSWVAT